MSYINDYNPVKLQVKRLARLVKLLRANAKNDLSNKFDMNDWGVCEADKEPGNSCGTTARAWGSAAVAGIFKREGVSFATSEDSVWDEKTDTYQPVMRLTVEYDGYEDLDAAAKFFGLNIHDAEMLFFPDNYPKNFQKGAKGELYVADRIENFIKHKQRVMKAAKALQQELISFKKVVGHCTSENLCNDEDEPVQYD